MTQETNQASKVQNSTFQLPIISGAVSGWQFASRAFAGDPSRVKQQWKSFFVALINPQLAYKWFEILKTSDYQLITTYRKLLYFKPFRAYMSIKWKEKRRIKVILDTYRYILSKGDGFKPVITHSEGIEIARFSLNETTEASLILGYDDRYRKEGELVLFFNCEQMGGTIAATAFSFEEMESGKWVSRIACIQGHAKNADNFSKTAQKLLHGTRPKSLVVFAAQELSRQLGFNAVYGAGDSIQTYRKKHLVHISSRHTIQFDYDAIWEESGGTKGNDGWYEIPLTPVRKSMQDIKTNKRSEYKRRYALLDDLSLKIADSVNRISVK